MTVHLPAAVAYIAVAAWVASRILDATLAVLKYRTERNPHA